MRTTSIESIAACNVDEAEGDWVVASERAERMASCIRTRGSLQEEGEVERVRLERISATPIMIGVLGVEGDILGLVFCM